jgi:hypothetical protein
VGSGGPVFFELNFAARRVREARSDRAISSAMAVAHGQTNCGRLPITSQLRSLGRMMRKPGQRKPKLLAWRGLFGRLHLFVRCTKAPEARFLRGALGTDPDGSSVLQRSLRYLREEQTKTRNSGNSLYLGTVRIRFIASPHLAQPRSGHQPISAAA